MYNPKTGAWSENANDDFNEHFETTYYLKYNIEKAIYSLDKIMKRKIDYSEFSNRCVYYHFYIDNLLNSLGHIRRRFFNNNVEQERIERNRKEYNYILINEHGKSICNYPIIGDNNIRNFIEHIDEKDEVLMNIGIYYGSFNVIYKGMNQRLKIELLNNEKKQNNLLNLLTKEYKILTVEDGIVKEYKLNLIELEQELKELKKINDKIWSFLTDNIF
ncbi:MAG: hypothetical protein E7310_04645 [Clostridiales bacterium]|nr:hypothetical protein [Clostridiales bacterium]